ncbi:hypothetical protein INS90_06070 [Trueperella pecoris]|uniref:Uncharacterized protein n=1 Tax=Trueperella pecoris TaxID=2733571 RepID=A0A7M1QYD0_9ACTO|nr:hypothetical protein [Trueperella pecoris]QOR46866.1 hypothetical protein INS90_06070 [Trueperella pecoris]
MQPASPHTAFSCDSSAGALFGGGNVSGADDAPGILRGTFAGPAWLTGGTAGIEGSLLTGAFCLVATGLLLAYRRRKPSRPSA